ncbi:protein MpBHLH23 [Marchantia polymorpha subsp. ruderalis]|nr:hypothetical protein MARPO_0114s0037 [Marchantia polymorpha]BBN07749.1 hypothetical protein Mp_4g06170 [Marchantia polymorpha subsp. ruderalis]|eukprot:PTQ31224.1 hypothetical protein MARPO_0114s0037 [Marchantia polymorpha]
MCPELSQDVSQDHLSRVFYPESFIYDKFDHQHTLLFNHVPHCAGQYKPPDAQTLDAQGLAAGTHAPLSAADVGQHGRPSQAISIEMVAGGGGGGGGSHQAQQSYSVGALAPASAAPTTEASAEYPPLHISCSDNQLMPEIDCCGWMKDVLDEFLLTSQDIPRLAPLVPGHSSTINLPSVLSPLGLPSKLEFSASLQASPPPAGNAPQKSSSMSPRSVEAMQTGELAAAAAATTPKSPPKSKVSSPTPGPLKVRASKRLQREDSTRKVSKWAQKANLANVDQVEHVIRERQRRDDMSYKIATLERLLPQGPKRDRASIVHDSVQYVKSLQQRVEELTKKSAELQMMKRSVKFSAPVKVSVEDKRARSPEDSQAPFRLVNFHLQVEGGDEAVTVSNCRCNLDFLSLTMKALEQLQLDLCRSSITKMPDGAFFCIIACKARVGGAAVPSSAALALKLKAAVEL